MGLIGLGVTGCVGAYKAVEIARGLQEDGHDVVAVMTTAAQRFVGPITFEAITKRRVITDQFEPGSNLDIEHIALASEIELLLVAPATANIIGKMSHGIADDFLTTLYLATGAPVVVAPAMNTKMFAHDAVIENLRVLRRRGVHVVEPGEGYLACGWIGKGRLAEPVEVIAAVRTVLRPSGDFAGRCIVVTAGPTFEDLDPVRYIGNRSSGRMGMAIAEEAVSRGARVVLILGPVGLEPPRGAEVVRIRSAAELQTSVMEFTKQADAVVMAAAVADYTPSCGAGAQKLHSDRETFALDLVKTDDILAELGRSRGESSRPVLVGFAAETEDILLRAKSKLDAKRVDLIVANDVSRVDVGFDVENNVATFVERSGNTELPLQPKRQLAREILERVSDMLGRRRLMVTSDANQSS